MPRPDFYAMDEAWTLQHQPYSAAPEGDCVSVARRVWADAFGND